jgi:hypothetical protein
MSNKTNLNKLDGIIIIIIIIFIASNTWYTIQNNIILVNNAMGARKAK